MHNNLRLSPTSRLFGGTDACQPSAYSALAARPRSASADPIALLVQAACQSSAYTALASRQSSISADLTGLVATTACQRRTSTAPTGTQLSASADPTALVAPLLGSLRLVKPTANVPAIRLYGPSSTAAPGFGLPHGPRGLRSIPPFISDSRRRMPTSRLLWAPTIVILRPIRPQLLGCVRHRPTPRPSRPRYSTAPPLDSSSAAFYFGRPPLQH